MSTSRRVAKNVISLSLVEVIIRLLGALLTIYIARELGPNSYGQLATALAYMTFFNLFSDLGLSMLGVREIAKDKAKTNHVGTTILVLQSLISVVLLSILYVLMVALNHDSQIVLITVIFGLGMIPTALNVSYLFQAHENMEYQAIIKLVTQASYAVLGFILIALWTNILVLPIATLISLIIGAALSILLAKKILNFKLGRVEVSGAKQLIRQSVPFLIGGLMIQIYYSADSIILQWIKGSTEVGYYSVAYRLPLIIFGFYWFFTGAIFPVLANTFENNKQAFNQAVRLSQKIGGVLAFPIAVGGFVLADKIILTIFGPDYEPSVPLFRVLILLPLIIFINSNLGAYLVSTGKQKQNTIAATAAAVINIVLNILLIPRYGAIAAAWATIASEVVAFMFMTYHARTFIAIKTYITYMARPLFCAGVMAAGLLLVRDLNLVFSLGIGSLIYLVTFIATGGVHRSDVNMLRKMINSSK